MSSSGVAGRRLHPPPGLPRPFVLGGPRGRAAAAGGAPAVGPFVAADPFAGVDPALETALGLGLLVVVTAVIVRMGAIPAHVWASRLAEAVPLPPLPPTPPLLAA